MGNRLWRSLRRPLLISLAMIMILSMLAACSKGTTSKGNQERVLRIATTMGGPDDEWFRMQFTDMFEMMHQNIKLEILSTYDETNRYGGYDPEYKPKDQMEILKELMDGSNPPDIIITQFEQLQDLIDENRLMPLDPLLSKNNIDINELATGVVEGIKMLSSDNRLYALTPTFSSSVLMYNAQIFEDASLPYPTDGMTWDDVFMLAEQVAQPNAERPVYGFAFNRWYGNIFYDMQSYIAPLQLKMFDDSGKKMTVNTPQWERALNKMVELQKKKIFPEPPDYSRIDYDNMGPYDHDAFLSGKLAMVVTEGYMVNELININKNAANIKNYTPIRWDIVTLPTHPEAPGIGGNMYMSGLTAIAANAQNPDDAWEFFSFINGEDWARVKGNSTSQQVTWKKYNRAKDGLDYNVEAFLALSPAQPLIPNRMYRDNPNLWRAQDIGYMKLNEVMNGNKSVQQALQEWETEGDAALQSDGNYYDIIEPMPMPMPDFNFDEDFDIDFGDGDFDIDFGDEFNEGTSDAISEEEALKRALNEAAGIAN